MPTLALEGTPALLRKCIKIIIRPVFISCFVGAKEQRRATLPLLTTLVYRRLTDASQAGYYSFTEIGLDKLRND